MYTCWCTYTHVYMYIYIYTYMYMYSNMVHTEPCFLDRTSSSRALERNSPRRYHPSDWSETCPTRLSWRCSSLAWKTRILVEPSPRFAWTDWLLVSMVTVLQDLKSTVRCAATKIFIKKSWCAEWSKETARFRGYSVPIWTQLCEISFISGKIITLSVS